MAKTFWEFLAVEVSRTTRESTCRFAAILDGPSGTFRLEDVPAEDVVCYARLQRCILERAGVLWTHSAVQGRGAEVAADQWGVISEAIRTVRGPGDRGTKPTATEAVLGRKQDGVSRRTGIEPPATIDLDRELHALRTKKRAYDQAVRDTKEPAKRPAAMQTARANRLSTSEEFRRQRLEDMHLRIRAIEKKMEAGTLDRDEGERQIKRLVGLVKKPAA